MKRQENESYDKYRERLKQEKIETKKAMRGQVIQCKCGKVRTTLRKVAGAYVCPTCYPGDVIKDDGQRLPV